MRHTYQCLFHILTLCLLAQCSQIAGDAARVKIVGTMRSVMHGGDLKPTISIDTLIRDHLYGIGPMAYLKGEITIIDGVSYLASVLQDSTIRMDTSFKAAAPFFVYANVESWREVTVPDEILTNTAIERFLAQVTADRTEPFTFRLSGVAETAMIHVVNLPEGAKVANSDAAHNGQEDYVLRGQSVDVIGFFSKLHQGIFTHHNSNTHMHLITTDRKMMGHVDGVAFKRGSLKLWVSRKG